MARGIGVRFDETMSGTYHLTTAPARERRFVMNLNVHSTNLPRTLWDGKLDITGTVEMDGFTACAPFEGTLIIKIWPGRYIRYAFDFMGDDGEPYRYAGQKTIRHLYFGDWYRTLHGTVTDADGKEVAKGTVEFDMRDLLPFLRSYRLTHEPA